MKYLAILLLLLPVFCFGQSPTPPPSLNLCSNVYTAHGTIAMTGVTGVDISSYVINCGATATVGIKLTNCTNVHIHRVKISNSTQQGILLINCHNIEIDSCDIQNVSDGIHVNGSTGFVVNGCNVHDNYFKNINGPFPLGNFIQYNNINGAGIRLNHNYGENIAGVAQHPQDLYSVFQCNGLSSDTIQIWNNYARGGQILHDSGGAAGIVVGDVGGSWQSCRGNYMVDVGAVGIQCQGGTHIKVDHNFIYGSGTPFAYDGMASGNYSGVASNNVEMSYNRINFRQTSGTVLNKYYDSANGNPLPTGWSTNTPDGTPDAGITAAMLPTDLIQSCTLAPPNISYSPNTFNLLIGQFVSIFPVNTGGAASSYSISGSLPAGIALNSTTGQITGTATANYSTTTLTVTATNTAGNGTAPITFTVGTAPVIAPNITYSTPHTYTQGQVITPLSPTNTGGGGVTYSGSVPSGLTLNPGSGIISGTVVSVAAATYPITGTNSAGSSTFPISITVNPPPVTRPSIGYAPSSQVGVYGYALTPMIAANSGGAGTYSISPSLPTGLTFNTGSGIISGVPHNIQSATNYTVSCVNSAGSSNAVITLTFNKAPLTLHAISQSKLQGTANPALTFSYSGLVNGDTSITGLPTLSTTAILSSPIGTYPITISGGSSSKYNLSYVNGALTVYRGIYAVGKIARIFHKY